MKHLFVRIAFVILVITVLTLGVALAAAERRARTPVLSTASIDSAPRSPSPVLAPSIISSPSTTPSSKSSALDVCNQPIDSTNKWDTYDNTEFGFSISLDRVWSGYNAIQQHSDNGVDDIEFKVPEGNAGTVSATDFQTALIVVVAPSSKWDYFLPLGGPQDYITVPTFIGRNANYIFGYLQGNGAPFGPLDVRCEISRVMETFRILGH